MSRPRIATTSLAGCFGCHMSLLDLDERILELAELVEFDRSPIDDYKDDTRAVDLVLPVADPEPRFHAPPVVHAGPVGFERRPRPVVVAWIRC